MSLILTKGESLELTKAVSANALTNLVFAGGWDPVAGASQADVDLVVVFLGENGKPLVDDGHLDTLDELRRTAVYYGKLISDCGSVVHAGYNRTGAGEGDDEKVTINLTTLPAHIHGFKLVATIFNARQNNLTFSVIENEFVRIFNPNGEEEIVFNTDFGFPEVEGAIPPNSCTFEAVEVKRSPEGWQVTAVGQAFDVEMVDYINHLLAA